MKLGSDKVNRMHQWFCSIGWGSGVSPFDENMKSSFGRGLADASLDENNNFSMTVLDD